MNKKQKHVRDIISTYKTDSGIDHETGFYWNASIDIYDKDNKLKGFLYPIGSADLYLKYYTDLIPMLAKWRSENIHAFLSQNKISIKNTSKWLNESVIENKDKILFLIYDLELNPIGHIGLAAFEYENDCCEIDNVIRGENNIPGMMANATNAIIEWAVKELEIHNINLRVKKDNSHAIKFYEKNNFKYNGEDEEFNKMKWVRKIE